MTKFWSRPTLPNTTKFKPGPTRSNFGWGQHDQILTGADSTEFDRISVMADSVEYGQISIVTDSYEYGQISS